MLRAFGILTVSVLTYAVPVGLALAQQPQRGPAPAPLQRQETESDAETLLDRSLSTDPASVEAAKAKAAQTPPATQDQDVLAAFFFDRAAAAYAAGSPRQQLEDLRRAADHARRGATIDKTQVLQRLANVETDRGLRAVAVRTMTEAIALNPPNRRGRLLSLHTNLARLNVQAGNVEGADAALLQVRALRREMENDPRFRSSAGSRRTVAQAVSATGPVLLQKGQYVEAEAAYRDALAIYERLDTPGDRQNVLNQRAGMATAMRLQGRLAEAENEVRQVLSEAQREFGASSQRTSGALMQLATVLADQGRFVEAEGLMRKGIELLRERGFQGTGNPRVQLAGILAGLGKWREALGEFDTARRSFRNNVEEFETMVRRNTIYGLAQLWGGRTRDGLDRLRGVYENNLAELGDKHYVTAESRGFYATALAVAGENETALAEFVGATEILLSRSRESTDSDDAGSASAQDQRLRMILESYVSLLALVRGTELPRKHGIDPVDESFRMADAARSRGVLRALTASAARSAAGNPQLADAARRVQDAEKQISALNGMLANAISARAADRDQDGIRNLRRRIDGLRDERGKLLREIEQKFPDYARLIDPRPATIADVKATLRPGEAMVALLSGTRRTVAWVVPAEGQARMIFASIDRNALTASINRVRKALDPNAATLDDIPDFDVAEAHKLYATLLQPAEGILRGARSLFVVPDGPFGQLPLAVLVTAPVTVAANDADGVPFSRYRSVPWLIRQASVTQLPSVASLAALRALPAGNAQRRPFVGFGDPWFSKEQAAEAAQEAAVAQVAGLTTRGIPIRLRSAPKGQTDFTAQLGQLPRLADTADEVRAVGAALRADPARDLFIGAKASASQVKALDLSAWRIVMFATHGLVPGDLNGLNQPALALSAPDVTGNSKDGLLTVEDILALKLNADWVVLSACNTAAGQGAGAEAVSGLGRAFFYAGTRALLVSNWPVETSSARTLTTDLFRRQVENPALGRAEALRQAELALIDGPGFMGPDSKPLFSYAHPIFWAPFSLVGDGGTAGK